MHPLGALMLSRYMEEERDAALERRRRSHQQKEPGTRAVRAGAWSAILEFPRFMAAGSKS